MLFPSLSRLIVLPTAKRNHSFAVAVLLNRSQIPLPLKLNRRTLKIYSIGSKLTKLNFVTLAKLFSRIATLHVCICILVKRSKLGTLISELTSWPCYKLNNLIPPYIVNCNFRYSHCRKIVQLLSHEKHYFNVLHFL
ncbi:MAG: hypothetical protein ACTS6G_01180 [Candidatus Hodgkinia cicadicola]